MIIEVVHTAFLIERMITNIFTKILYMQSVIFDFSIIWKGLLFKNTFPGPGALQNKLVPLL